MTLARRRHTGGSRGARAWEREGRPDEPPGPPEPYVDEAGPCADRPHVLAVAAAPLSWDVVDELDSCVSVGGEAHLVLTLPRSPVLRDPDLHILWERRMALDVADRQREVSQLWPERSLVRVETVTTDPTADRHRGPRRTR